MSPRTDISDAAAYARNVRVTWWYTAGSLLFFHVFTLFLWLVEVLVERAGPPVPLALALFAAGSAGSLATAVALLIRYRLEPVDEPEDRPRRPAWVLLAASAVSCVLLGVATGSLLFAVAMTAYALCLVRWPPGVRLRLALLLMVVVSASWFWQATRLTPEEFGPSMVTGALFAALLVPLTATSLWWWDIVRELDRARRAEGRLAAAQERLRLASDLHDLQGHHLQVIALQLELAEKMLARNPDAALDQVRAARASVDEARRGTRDLAARFRGVPLPDELANAADLLRAAGLRVHLDVDPDAADAPADVLGPVIRECTTNILKHGAGVEASLALSRVDGTWRLTIVNDARAEASPVGDGAGLAGIASRVGAVGGTMDATASDGRFTVTVRVPTGVEA